MTFTLLSPVVNYLFLFFVFILHAPTIVFNTIDPLFLERLSLLGFKDLRFLFCLMCLYFYFESLTLWSSKTHMFWTSSLLTLTCTHIPLKPSIHEIRSNSCFVIFPEFHSHTQFLTWASLWMSSRHFQFTMHKTKLLIDKPTNRPNKQQTINN